MKRPARRSYYPLDELLMRDQYEFPDGKTLAVKRAAFPGKDGLGDGLARLNVVDASPDDYVIDRHHLASGLSAVTAPLWVEDSRLKKVKRRNGVHYTVEALRFSGVITLSGQTDIPVKGACVPGELATGFVHLLDAEHSQWLFEQAVELALSAPESQTDVQAIGSEQERPMVYV